MLPDTVPSVLPEAKGLPDPSEGVDAVQATMKARKARKAPIFAGTSQSSAFVLAAVHIARSKAHALTIAVEMLRYVTVVRDRASRAPGTILGFVALMIATAVWGFVRPGGLGAWVSAALSLALAYLIAHGVVIVWRVWNFCLILAVIGAVLILVTTPAARGWVLWLELGQAGLSLALLSAPSTRRFMLGDRSLDDPGLPHAADAPNQ